MRCALALFVLVSGLVGCEQERDVGFDDAITHCSGGRASNLSGSAFMVSRQNRGLCYAQVRLDKPDHYTSRGPGGASWNIELDVEAFAPTDDEQFQEAELMVCETGRGYGRCCVHVTVGADDVGKTVKVDITGMSIEQRDHDWEFEVRLDPQGVFRGEIEFSGGSLVVSSHGDGDNVCR
ncbi:MAG: hypothetical protein KC925_00740 [Candidatus Doudnabacteria bacterium]|nr:hypothetical protein [Candidatus Doudnabacteria bacterium]